MMAPDKLKKVSYIIIAGLILFLTAYGFMYTQNNPEKEKINKSATCIEVENQINSKYGNQANCSCYRTPEKEEKVDVPQRVRDEADLYFIKCSLPQGEKSFSVWLVNGTNETINSTLKP